MTTNILILNIHKVFENILPKYLGKDNKNLEYRIVHKGIDLTACELTEAIKKFNKISDSEQVTILNPDTKENQSVSDFVDYVKVNGLEMWDTGEADI